MSTYESLVTLFAAFPNREQAEKAVGALLDNGFKASGMSIVVGGEPGRPGHPTPEDLSYTQTEILAKTHDPLQSNDPLDNSERDTPIRINPVYPNDQLHTGEEFLAGGDSPTSDGQSTDVPGAHRYFNRGLEDDDYNKHYDANVETDNDGREPAPYDPNRAAKYGVTTTTAQDAEVGAEKGALWGLGLGALAAIAAVSVPGFGIVLGGGALVGAIESLIVGAGAGAVTGGVVGYLKDQGVPAQTMTHYENTIRSGGAMLAVHVAPDESAHAQDILTKYGATFTHGTAYIS